ncbi:HNH endonuclease [bacterium]|nr:HNH endonuclease [bacterium]
MSCGWDKARCDAHHREPKAKGGKHTIQNGMVLCPNCHRIAHEAGGGC